MVHHFSSSVSPQGGHFDVKDSPCPPHVTLHAFKFPQVKKCQFKLEDKSLTLFRFPGSWRNCRFHLVLIYEFHILLLFPLHLVSLMNKFHENSFIEEHHSYNLVKKKLIHSSTAKLIYPYYLCDICSVHWRSSLITDEGVLCFLETF